MGIKLLIDYFTFVIKRDDSKLVTLDFVFNFLGLDISEFTMVGPRMHYSCCYMDGRGVCIYETLGDRAGEMGICVSMSGTGCRYFESVLKNGKHLSDGEVWISFLRRLRKLNAEGYGVRVSRIDVAADDVARNGGSFLLNLDDVESSTNSREFVSQFRCTQHYTSKYIVTDQVLGRCLYFGVPKSSVCCRFYDKLAEQLVQRANDPARLKELDGITHWVRMEFVFRRAQAIKVVNAICDAADFPKFYAKLVNGYVRFVHPDNDNVSRSTVKSWWGRFLGTLEQANLSTGDFKPRNFARVWSYYEKYLSTTIFTLLSRVKPNEFFKVTVDSATKRLKRKHLDIIEGRNDGRKFDDSSLALWRALQVIPIEERVPGVAL